MTSRSIEGFLHTGGNVTKIASALGLDSSLLQLTPHCGSILINLDFCMDRGLMRHASFHPYPYRLLIDDQAFYYFTLPDPLMTCVSNPTNWKYSVDGWGETIEVPSDSPMPEYTPEVEDPASEYTPGRDAPHTTVLTNNLNLQETDVQSQSVVMHTELATLLQEVANLSLQIELNDATYVSQANELAREVADLRCQLAEIQCPEHTIQPPSIR